MWEPGRVGTPVTSEALSTLSTTAVCIWIYAGPLITITSGCTRSKRLQFGAQAPVTWFWLFDFGCPDTRLQNPVIFLGSTVSHNHPRPFSTFESESNQTTKE